MSRNKTLLIRRCKIVVINRRIHQNKLMKIPSYSNFKTLNYCLWRFSSETVNFQRPFLRRPATTLRPFAVDILSRNPCLFLLLRFDGWKVRFISLSNYCAIKSLRPVILACKGKYFLKLSQQIQTIINLYLTHAVLITDFQVSYYTSQPPSGASIYVRISDFGKKKNLEQPAQSCCINFKCWA